MNNSIIILKIGGSAITDKEKPYTLRPKVIKKLALEIKRTKKTNLIIVHGAGSFAHTSAKLYGGKKGYKSSYGIAKVSSDAAKLNQLFVDILIEEKIPAISMRPMSMITASNGKLNSHHFKALKEMLNQNLIPVLYGDVIWDKEWKSTIFSGEKIISEISKYLVKENYTVEKIIQVGETNGVYDSNKKTIKEINLKNMNEIQRFFEKTNRTDVTGGIKHKVEESIILAKKGIQTFIINGLISNELYNAIMKKSIKGTIITKI